MATLYFVPLEEIRRIRAIMITDKYDLCEVLADLCRINTLYMVMRAGSGHLGSSFSSMDIVVWLWTQEMANPNEKGNAASDIYFSSKGHDAPGLYSLLIALEKLDFEYLHKLRRLGGLPGHPDVHTPYIAANTGSLGMGISKARGMVLANRLQGRTERKVYVLLGDGELQEGQIWEALQPAANSKLCEITVIVDHNKIQSDTFVDKVSDLGGLENKFRAFGWEAARCDGHNFQALESTLSYLERFGGDFNRPQALIADTIKGKGVSFMERVGEDGLYRFHSGALALADYNKALSELVGRVNGALSKIGEKRPLSLESVMMSAKATDKVSVTKTQRLVEAYGSELASIARERKSLVVLDADLCLDCGLHSFIDKFPERFIECGIAEQDMASVAGGLALRGMLPVVHSFAAFLSQRPNEQIYNNAMERTKIIYVGALAGLLPGGPGHSHQAVRDIAVLGAIPGLTMIQPCNETETRMALRWAVYENTGSTYIRLVSIPCELNYELPSDYKLEKGKGVFVRECQGEKEAVIIAYGPVMLKEAVWAADYLWFSDKGRSIAVINLPWLNCIDGRWLCEAAAEYPVIFTADDHNADTGQGVLITDSLVRNFRSFIGDDYFPRIVRFGVKGISACGQNDEVLCYHGLDFESLARRIEAELV